MTDSNETRVLTTPIPEDKKRTDAKGGDAQPAQMLHEVGDGSRILVEEQSGVAAAEATGRLRADNAEPPAETAGSG